MARMRTLKIGFFQNDSLAELRPLERLLFAGLWLLADREGRLENRPKRIKAELIPYDQCDVAEMLARLETAGFIRCYEVCGVKCIQVVNFLKHQCPNSRELESVLPPEPDHENPDTIQIGTGENPSTIQIVPSTMPDTIQIGTGENPESHFREQEQEHGQEQEQEGDMRASAREQPPPFSPSPPRLPPQSIPVTESARKADEVVNHLLAEYRTPLVGNERAYHNAAQVVLSFFDVETAADKIRAFRKAKPNVAINFFDKEFPLWANAQQTGASNGINATGHPKSSAGSSGQRFGAGQ